jgi:hypothetical protein
LGGANPYNDTKAQLANEWSASVGSAYLLPGVDGVDLWPLLSGASGSVAGLLLAASENSTSSSLRGKRELQGPEPHGSTSIPLSTYALLNPSTKLKLIYGNTQTPAGWSALVYPNSTSTDADTNFGEDCTLGCLFNVSSDPGEHFDLASDMPEVVASMAAELAELTLGFFQNGDTTSVDACPVGFDQIPGCDSCAQGAFPQDLSNVQCFGLTKQNEDDVASEDACRAACCGDSQCNAWQWCDGDGSDDSCVGPACWIGSAIVLDDCSATSAHAAGWSGQGSPTPPCALNETVPCACWMGANKWGGFFGPYQEISL